MLVLTSVLAAAALTTAPLEMEIAVDLTELPRHLVRADLAVDLPPHPDGTVELVYPLWIPGAHGPSGPVQNVAGLTIAGCDGENLLWERDPFVPERVMVAVPTGCGRVRVSTTYIASQPTANSRSADDFGWSELGAFNWNTVLWSPAGVSHQAIEARGRLLLPPGWQAASSLDVASATGDELAFEPVPLAELVDSPVIAGRHLVTTPLDLEGFPPHRFHTVAPEHRLAEPAPWLVGKLEEMVRQTVAVFGPFPRERFDFLHVFADGANLGLEHAESTLMGDETDVLFEAEEVEGVVGGGAKLSVIPHEYVHAWCGKLAAPSEMVQADYQTPLVTDLLWVYEGLTSYYDLVVAARSGLLTEAELREEVLGQLLVSRRRTGRLWRSVGDTARSAWLLRDKGEHWFDLRRGQDYYGEGALVWLEADAVIRRGSGGTLSLDDVVHRFFDVPVEPVGAQHGYGRSDVIEALAAVWPEEDWDAFVRERIEEPSPDLSVDRLLERIGARIEWRDEPSEVAAYRAKKADDLDLRSTLGFRLDEGGVLSGLVPGSPGDRGKLVDGMRIVAVDGWLFSKERFERAQGATAESGRLELLVTEGDRVADRTIAWDRGHVHPRLVSVSPEEDLLGTIAAPRTRPSGDGGGG